MKIIGMMSGTSLDGVDAVLAEYRDDVSSAADTGVGCWNILAHAEAPIPKSLRHVLYQLNFPKQTPNELHAAKTAEQQLTHCYADAYQRLMVTATLPISDISAIAAHGQTVRHEPNANYPYTVQLLNGALLSQLTKQTVVCDFRSKDIAAGGQGAPLAPLFHRELFGNGDNMPLAVVNIGGISNISVLDKGNIQGFDCGPGNCLLDEWIMQHQGKPFDDSGRWASQGRVLPELLERLLRDNYFAKQSPKSTGRDIFHLGWLQPFLHGDESPVNVMRTLVRLTAVAIADSTPNSICKMLVVGGGAKNSLLMSDFAELLPGLSVQQNQDFDAQHIEALGFAMLGRAALLHQPLPTQRITGAKAPVILGAIYAG